MVHADMCNDVGSFISAAKFPSSLGQVPLFKFQQCEDYSEQSKPYSEPLTFAWQRCVLQREYELVHAFNCAYIELWMHLGSLESTQEARVPLGYRLEQLLSFFRALQTSRVHP